MDGSYHKCSFNLIGNSVTRWLYLCTFSPTRCQASSPSTFSPLGHSFHCSHANASAMATPYAFNLHFSRDKSCETSFHVFIGHSYIRVKYLFKSFALFKIKLFVLLICMCPLYILDKKRSSSEIYISSPNR